MKAVTRVAKLLSEGLALAAALALVPSMAGAQEVPTTNNTTAPDTVGPRELQNFKLPGTVTRPADQPATTAAPPPDGAPAAETANRPGAQQPAPRSTGTEPARQAPRPATPAPTPQHSEAVAPPASIAPPPASDLSVASPAAPSSFPPAAQAAPAPSSGPAVPLYAWLIAALVLGAGGAFLFRRNRSREAFAGGAELDEFTGPEIEPALPPPSPAPVPPAPTPAPPPPAPPVPTGIVSTRLRPWIEVSFSPIRCVLDEQRATIDFALEIFNSGSGVAREILIDATAFNAGPTQDNVISGFFATPREQGQRIGVLPPLERTALELQLTIPRNQLQPYELAGQQVFVPIVALNAVYRWGTGDGQTSASYLVGRGTQTEKLAPFRIDSGPRIFRGLAAKALAAAVRR